LLFLREGPVCSGGVGNELTNYKELDGIPTEHKKILGHRVLAVRMNCWSSAQTR